MFAVGSFSTLNSIFLSPLLSKALRLTGFTFRTISLFAVFLIKRMPKLTVGFESILSANTFRINQRIFSYSNNSQVVGLNTMSILANMIDDHTLRNIPDSHIISNSMCSAVFPSEKEGSVTISIQSSKPQITAIFLDPLRVISNFLLLCVSHAFISFTAFKYNMAVKV